MIAENFIDGAETPVVKVKGKPGRKPKVVVPSEILPIIKDPANASFNPGEVVKTEPKVELKKNNVVLKNTAGEEVDQKNYFYSKKGEDTAPQFFIDKKAIPVDREDMIAVFNKIFKPKFGLLFYKEREKEVYLIIVPLKYSSIIGVDHDSLDGEFQAHAISFLSEGSVNIDTLRMKLTKVASTIPAIHIAE